MKIDASTILASVAVIMLVLGLADVVRHRRITPGAKARLLVAAIMAAVQAWLHWHG